MLPLLFVLPALGVLARTLPDRGNPPLSKSTGFRIVARTYDTELMPDLSPPINNWYFSTAHTGAGFSTAVLSSNASVSRLWYQNGTSLETDNDGITKVLTDGGTPPSPYGISLVRSDAPDYPSEHRVDVNAGPGDPMWVETNNRYGWPTLMAAGDDWGGKWVACNRKIKYYESQDWTFVVIRYMYDGEQPLGPEVGCTQVDLVVQCAVLNDLPAGSYSNHDHAAEVDCAVDASALVREEGPN